MIHSAQLHMAAACLACVLAGMFARPALADDFRVDNKVFFEDQKEPVSRSSTIFAKALVYDFLEKPAEIFIFDRPREQFILLDAERRVAAQVAMQDVMSFTEQLRQRAAAQRDPYVQFLANPTFEQHYEPATTTLSLSSPWLSYQVQGMAAPGPAAMAQYREFSDCYARLGPILDAAARPPFARMILNEALQKEGLIPQKLTLTLTPKRGFMPKRIVIRSEHELIDRLSQADLDRVVQAQQYMTIFSPVGLEQYKR
jgi:hypothetical protein